MSGSNSRFTAKGAQALAYGRGVATVCEKLPLMPTAELEPKRVAGEKSV